MSKFKVGDKVRVIVDRSVGYPNHDLHYHIEMLRRGGEGEVKSIGHRPWGVAVEVPNPCGETWYYDEKWLELVSESPEVSREEFFDKVDSVMLSLVNERAAYDELHPALNRMVNQRTVPYNTVRAQVSKYVKRLHPEVEGLSYATYLLTQVIEDLIVHYDLVAPGMKRGEIRNTLKGQGRLDCNNYVHETHWPWIDALSKPAPESTPTYKVGDKVRLKTSGGSGLKVGEVYEVSDASGHAGNAVYKLRGSGCSFLDHWLEPADTLPFKVGDLVEWDEQAAKVTCPTRIQGVLTVSDITEDFLYFNGKTRDSHDGWLHHQFKKFGRTEVNPDDYGIPPVVVDTSTSLGESNMSIDTTVAVLNKTYIYGKDAENVTVDDVFAHISRLEAEAAKYDGIKNKPKAIKAKVDAIKAEIQKLVEFSDAKFAE